MVPSSHRFYARVICTSYVHRRDIDKTYSSCWLALVAVDSLVSLLARSCCYALGVQRLHEAGVIYHHHRGFKPDDILRTLQQEGIKVTERGIAKFLAQFNESGLIARKPRSGGTLKVETVAWTIVEQIMPADDEMVAKELQRL